MIEYILPSIKDTKDYLAALSLFKVGQPLTSEEVQALVGIYQKYGREVDNPAKAKLYLALDMLPGRTAENASDFAELELNESDLNALFLAKSIISGGQELTSETADWVVGAVQGGELTQPMDIFLARTVLDTIAGYRNFSGLREQAQALAEFLSDVGAAAMEKYSIIVEEVRIRCRQ